MKKAIVIICAILGMIVGVAVGESLKGVHALSWLSIGGAFGLQNPVTIDLSFIQFTIGFWCKVSICGVIFLILFAFLSKKILDWLRI
ncbi:MAG: DUF4321 domain-containing protein [Bacilli bacterium]|nr:DUF4321 domain-containing protein [Bacilli bacterium]